MRQITEKNCWRCKIKSLLKQGLCQKCIDMFTEKALEALANLTKKNDQ